MTQRTSSSSQLNLPLISESGATHIWITIAHGLAAKGGTTNGFADLPNLRSIQRTGLQVRRFQTGDANPKSCLHSLLFGSGSTGESSLSQLAAEAGRTVVQVLPWQHDRWIPDHTSVPHWSILEEILGLVTANWDDVTQGKPRFLSEGRKSAEDEAYFEQRVLGRFPGQATRFRETDALSAWMEWAADAFLRSVWYASARSGGGVFGVLTFPAPALLGEHHGPEGYDHGLELLDELLGRLMMLKENPEMSDSVLVVCGDHAHASSGTGPDEADVVPFAAVGPEIEAGTVVNEANTDDVAGFLRRLAGSRAKT